MQRPVCVEHERRQRVEEEDAPGGDDVREGERGDREAAEPDRHERAQRGDGERERHQAPAPGRRADLIPGV